MLRTAAITALVATAILLTACSNPAGSSDNETTYDVTYTVEASGNATADSIIYANTASTVEENNDPSLPWSKTVSLESKDAVPALSATKEDNAGSITATVDLSAGGSKSETVSENFTTAELMQAIQEYL
jgi:hypothetical protein